MGEPEKLLPVNNFLLIKKVVDDPEIDEGLFLIGTFVQTVMEVEKVPDKEEFNFEYRFGDMSAEVGSDYMQLRRQEPVKAKNVQGEPLEGTRSTFQTKIPLIIETVLESFPFHISTATADIELSSTFKGGTRLRPNLVLSQKDRRGNVCIQDLKNLSNKEATIDDILDKLDKTKLFDFISPYPEIRYEYDVKKKYCARYTLTFYCIKGGFTKFMTIILPIFLIAVINTINVLNDSFDFGDGPVDTADHLGVSSALGLTAVFLLPIILEQNTRQALWKLDNLYILLIFLSLMLSSFSKKFTGTSVPELFGMSLLWFSFLSPIVSAIRYVGFVNGVRRRANTLVENGAESNPFLKDTHYKPWKAAKEPFDESFATVDQVINEQLNNEGQKKSGYQKKEEGKFEVVSYH
mmetsp:Transcript_17360/g.22570  ORF Transcript_17360/g.22570 Transcript_17360/m.22570 type:complete len:406 (+) Transcript_17360:181-1398(+)